MCYSGGKDSTYTLAILKEKYHLNVLSVAFDNGFLPDRTMKNINNVVENLGVDHMMFKPRFDVLARIFSYCADHDVYPLKALERSSATDFFGHPEKPACDDGKNAGYGL
jgi:tRNA(Ile)-lysidine synthase TilS/MesJ